MILVDTNIFMYAAGAPHRHKASSVNFLRNAARLESIRHHGLVASISHFLIDGTFNVPLREKILN